MSDIKTGITPPGETPKDWLTVHAVDRPQSATDKSAEEQNSVQNSNLILLAAFAVQVKFCLATLNIKSLKTNKQSHARTNIKDVLQQIKKCFLLLAQEDVSFDPVFIQQLASCWVAFKEHRALASETSKEAAAIDQLLAAISSYPQKEEHNLDFYLSHFEQNQWLSFPLVEMLSSLHQLAEKNQTDNPLATWIQTIDTIVL